MIWQVFYYTACVLGLAAGVAVALGLFTSLFLVGTVEYRLSTYWRTIGVVYTSVCGGGLWVLSVWNAAGWVLPFWLALAGFVGISLGVVLLVWAFVQYTRWADDRADRQLPAAF